MTPSLFLKWANTFSINGLVRISATWSEAGIKLTINCLICTFFLTKHKSSYTCFILECCIGFYIKATTPVLSHQMTGMLDIVIPSSVRRETTHIISHVALATTLYSALDDEREITYFFFELLIIWLLFKSKRWPNTYFMSARSLPQSACAKEPKVIYEEVIEVVRNNKPCSIVPLRYLSTRRRAFQWHAEGCCIKWLSLLTLKWMYGLVIQTCWRAPIVLM